MTYTKHFDQHGRIKEIQYEIFRSLMYWITIQYDNMGRVTKREIKIGPFANTTKYGYEYDVDGQLQTVFLNEKMMWRYEPSPVLNTNTNTQHPTAHTADISCVGVGTYIYLITIIWVHI